MRAGRAVIGSERKRGQVTGRGGFARVLGCVGVGGRGMVIRAGGIGLTQSFVKINAGVRVVWRLVCEIKLLTGGEPYHTRDGEFLNRKIVFGLNQLLLTRLQLDTRAQGVDLGRSARLHAVGSLVVQSL